MKKGRTTHSNIKIKAGICRVSFRECQKNITSQYPHRYLHHKLLNLPKIQAPVMKTSILVDPLTSLKKAWAKSFQQSLSIIVTFRKAYACSCGQTTTQPMILYHRMSPWGQSSGCWQANKGPQHSVPHIGKPLWETTDQVQIPALGSGPFRKNAFLFTVSPKKTDKEEWKDNRGTLAFVHVYHVMYYSEAFPELSWREPQWL